MTGTASIRDSSVVRGSGCVEGHATIANGTVVCDQASVSEYATVNWSDIMGQAKVGGNAKIMNSILTGACEVYDNARLDGIHIRGTSCIFGKANLLNHSRTRIMLEGECKFGGTANFEGLETYEDFVKKYGEDKVKRVTQYGVILTDVWDMG